MQKITIDSLEKTSLENKFVSLKTTYVYNKEGLDYSNLDNWYIFPSKKHGALDVFVIYPTVVFDERGNEFADSNSEEMYEGAKSFTKESLSFLGNLNVNVYMPKYRQVNGVFLLRNKLDTNSVQDVFNSIPKHDIFNAMKYYLENVNGGNRFVTFSHSQGTLMNYLFVTEFLEKYVDEKVVDLFQNAWCIGVGLTDDVLNKTSYLKASTNATDLKTIISWNTATKNEIKNKYRVVWADKTARSINPINFTNIEGRIEANDSSVSLFDFFKTLNMAQYSKLTSATLLKPIENGGKFEGQVVMVDLQEKDFLTEEQIKLQDEYNFGYMHHYDINLFQGNIRENFLERYFKQK
ncbi:MAG: DUF3089 domain-containing protein [Rickettsiales bacterium]|nr:DUF3089 domain-containing protein [Rickettsiales bacterium]